MHTELCEETPGIWLPGRQRWDYDMKMSLMEKWYG